jgi:hypothetical protein
MRKSVGVFVVAVIVVACAAGAIYAIGKRSASPASEAAGPPAVSSSQAAQLALATTLEFDRAVKARDFRQFYFHTSDQYQHAMELERFNETFAWALQKSVDLSSVERTPPKLTTEPVTFANGVLHVEGAIPELRMSFTYEYLYENGNWRIAAIDIRPDNI